MSGGRPKCHSGEPSLQVSYPAHGRRGLLAHQQLASHASGSKILDEFIETWTDTPRIYYCL